MKNIYTRFILVLCVLIIGLSSAFAERVSQEDAALVAGNFLSAGDTTSSQVAQAPARTGKIRRVAMAEEAQYYVYENASGEGWVMVAANDVAHPILAYSDEGQFRTDNQPANLKSWLGGYNKQIKYAEDNHLEASEEIKAEWQTLRKGVRKAKQAVVVSPLLTTLWDQGEPYYNQCPLDGSERSVTGCVATAMAQVMYYWKWPEKGTGSYSYTSETKSLSCSANFGNTTYDWDNMLTKYKYYVKEGDEYATSTAAGTSTQQNAVAALMMNCGVAAEMDYTSDVSGAYSVYPNASLTDSRCAAYALIHNFGYKSSTLKCYMRSGGYGYSAVNDNTWHNLLKTELDAARPIMYAGSGSGGGHSFVCDGYDSGTGSDRKYHFNWGWSGACNGYYTVDALIPGTGGIGSGSDGVYNDDQDIIIGIIPDKPSVTITWMANGSTFTTTTQSTGKLVLPTSSPADCSGTGGKKFVGWTKSSSLSGSAPADLFKTVTTQTVTANTTYYAVYATASEGGGSGTPEKATSIAVGDQVIFVCESDKNEMTSISTYGVGTAYSTTPAGTYVFIVEAGSSTGTYAFKNGTDYISWTSGNSLAKSSTKNASSSWNVTISSGDANITNAGTSGRKLRWNHSSPRFACYTSDQTAIQLYKITAGTSYSDYSLTCGAACTNTPTMSFSAPTTVSKTTADGSFTKAVTISGKGSGQTVAYSSSDETIATVTNAGVVTLKGKVGSTTITASVEANGTYCAASASYTINVTAAPINVTLYYNNTSTTINNQPNPYTLPTGSPYNAAMCDGDWTFDGWLGSTYAKSETKPTYITQLTATGSAYAVYTTTVTTSGAPVRQKTAATATYTKVASGDVTDGQYLIVYEGGNVAFDGSLTTLDATSNTIAVTIDNSTITATNATEAAEFTIDASAGTILSASGYYIGATNNANSLNSSTSTAYTNTLSIDNSGNAVILGSGGAYLRYNSTSGQTRFRYFKSSSYSSQQAIQLYKKSTSGGTTSTTYYATSPDCATPPPATNVTVTFNANGGTGTMANQTILYNTPTNLTTNAYTRTGYTFQGWATTANGAKVYNDGASVTLTTNTELFAVWQINSFDVTFNKPDGATSVTVNGQTSSPQTANYNSTVTVVVTPDEAHTVSGISVTGGLSVTRTDNTFTFTMPNNAVEITITMTDKPKYDIKFYNMGVQIGTTQQVYAGATPIVPDNPTACDGYTFVGWWNAELGETNTESKTWIESFTATQNQSYYAVYTYQSANAPVRRMTMESTVTDVLTRETTGVTDGSTSYSNWSGKTSNSDAVYAGNSAGGNDAIQLRSNNSNSGIVTTASGGKAKKVVVEWESSTASGRKIDIYGNSSAYTAASNLYATATQGTKLGSIEYDSQTELTISGDYEYIGIRSNSGALYLSSVSIDWNTSGGTTIYYTTAPDCEVCEYQVTLTKGAESNGTFTLSKENNSYDNCKANFAVTVSAITVTDPSNYRFKDVTATGGHSTVTDNGDGTFTVTYEKGYTITSTITANFEAIPTHTVTWSENGDNSNQESYKEGASITFPNTASGCDDKVFRGWSGVEVDETNDEPTYVTSATMGTSDITYYAVFADENSGGGSGAFDGSSAGTYKIYALVGSTKNYATGSISGGKMSSTTDESQAAEFTFESVTGGLAIKTGTTYITYSGSTNLGTSSNAYAWTFASGTKGTWRVNSGTSGRGWIFRDGTGFGGYATNNVTAGGNEYYDLEIVGEGAGTSYSGYTTSCEIPENVTVKFDANGGTGTMADQIISYNTATALNQNAFTREGYTFQGWATSASGAKVYDDEEVVTLKRKVTTLYAVWAVNTYTISITQPTYGTISTSPAGSAACGAIVTVSISNVNSHYDFSSFTVTKAGGGTVALTGSGTSQTFTMPADNVTVTATLTKKQTYIVTWSADGDESNKVEYIQGENIVFPSSAEGCGDKTFVGWSATQFTETDDVPSFVTSATMGTSNLIYYAVYADAGGSGSSSNVDDQLTRSTTGISNGSGYSDWSGKSGTSGAVYAGNSAGGNNSIQLRASDNAGIVSTTSPGKIKKVVVDWNSNTASARVVDVYASNTAYTSSANLFGSTPLGTKVGSITYGSQTELTITGDYAYVGVRSHGNALYLNSVSFTWAVTTGGSYSNYTTSCGASISAKSGKWLTSASGQKVKTAIEVKARGFDAATTLSASSDNGNFSVSLAATTVPVEGLTTTLTIEYMPASAGATESGTITLTAGDVTKTITVNGRSLPDEFLIITKKDSKWYALPANMTGKAGLFDGVEVTPDNTTTPTAVATSPSTVVYNLKAVASGRYATAGNCVRLVGNNNLCLYGSLDADATGIHNNTKLTEANAANTEWLLTTTDGVQYTIANPNHADYAEGRRLAYGSKFGLYKAEAVFYIVPAGCSTKPTNVVTVARRTDVNFSWNSSAAQMKIDVYSNEGMSTLVKSETVEASPHLMDGLEQETDYWYRLTPVGDDACAVTGSFRTNGPTIEVVEWKEDAVVVYVDIDEGVNPKVIIDGEQEHGLGSGVIATELFFSKYFEGAGNMKLVSIYNGTTHNISLANYKLYTKNCSTPDNETQLANSSFGSTTEYPINTLGTIKTGQEIVFFTRPDAPKNNSTDAEKELYNCSNSYLEAMAAKNGADENPRWIECKDGTTFPAMKFNGNDAICLEKNETLIDVIGSTGTPGKSKNCANRLNDVGWPITVKNIDYQKASNDESFDVLFAATSKPHTTEQQRLAILAGFNVNLEDEEINLYTARCILFRDKNVTSGEKAVALNTGADFVTAGNHTYQGQNYSTEWNGRYVCMTSSMQTAAGVESDSKATCNSYHELGVFDYSEYYTDWNTISDDKTLDQFETETEGLYQIPVDELSQYSCLNLRFQLVKDEVLLTEAPVQVPIFVTDERTTADPIFTEIMKTESTHEPLYPESVERCRTCGVLVLGTGTLTKDNTGAEHDISEVGNLTLYPGGKLVVPNSTSLTASSITCRVEKDNVPVTDLKGNLITKDNQLTVTRRIRNDRYYFFSLPYDCLLKDVQWADGTQAEYGVDYLILEYDGETRAEEGSYVGWPGHWKNIEDGIIHAGKGYNIGVSSSTPKELVFPMAIGGTNLTEAEHAKYAEFPVDMKEYFGQYTAIDDNWNLIAHPYLTKIDCTPTGDAAVDVEWETCTSCEREADDPTQQIEPKSGTLEDGGATWQVTANGELIITGDGHFPDYGSPDQTPWAYARDKIKSVKISGSIVRIGNCAFANFLSLKTVVIASPVTQIATQVFANCSTLVSINIERPAVYIIDVAEDAFLGFDDTMLKGITLSVPGSLYDEYYNGTSTSSQSSIWKKMTLMKVEDSSTSGDGTTTNPAPQRIEPRRTIDPNPESGVLYVNIPYEITKSDGTKSVDYETATPISSITDIPPFTAVFIQGVGRGQMTFTKSESGSHAPWRRSKASITGPDESIFVGVTIHGNGQSDGAALRLRPDFHPGYKAGFDLTKLMQFYTPRPRIYMMSQNTRLSFLAISDDDAKYLWQPVGVYAYEPGTYTIALSDKYPLDQVAAVYLRDAQTGVITNLMHGNYTIETTKQLYTNTRFSIRVMLRREEKVDTPTFIEPVDNPNAPHKFIRDGLMYIMRDGKVYDLTGTPVQDKNIMLNH